jgi:hypothetical protein
MAEAAKKETASTGHGSMLPLLLTKNDMGKVYEVIDERIQEWIAAQKVFFVATAPLRRGPVSRIQGLQKAIANLQRAHRRGEIGRLQNQTQYNLDRWPSGSKNEVTLILSDGFCRI